jgi:NAD(P)-dependent dehydrogenase (short-subunit alcohol dehydrogenase family)
LSPTAKLESGPLQDQVAIVTGGGRGIGRALAQAIAAAGAHVAVLARSANELAETVSLIAGAGGRARAFPLDVTDAEKVRATFAEIERSLGPADLLINNAGVLGPLGPFWENDFDEWWRAMDVNLRGPLLCTHAALPGMIARGRGRIINVASGAGAIPIAHCSAYVAGKTALIRFTENVAIEAKPYGVAAFAISPGTVRTSLAEYSLNSAAGQKWLPWFKRIFDEGKNVPVERSVQLVLALASGKADVLSGRFLGVSDDLDAIVRSATEVEKDNLYSLQIHKLGEEAPAYNAIRASAERLSGTAKRPDRFTKGRQSESREPFCESDRLARASQPALRCDVPCMRFSSSVF